LSVRTILTLLRRTLIQKSLENSLTCSKGATLTEIKKVVENAAADYELEPMKQNPVEIAARPVALGVLKRILEQSHN
jgi:hypothetical protein